MIKSLFAALFSAFLFCGMLSADETPAISIFGDSYSSFEGSSPQGNAIGYFNAQKNQNDVCKVEQTWWHQAIALLGGRLEKIICGGAPLDPKIAADFRSLGIDVWEGYGITECSPLIAVDVYYHSKPSSVGPAVTSCMVRIEDAVADENGHEIGEICVKGKNVMLGYYKDEAATADAFTADGWFRTGDLGYLDGEGYIYITGRKKSVIVLENGKNVFPEEIEEYLASVDKIAECVVVGRKSGRETVLTAVVYPNMEKFAPDMPESEMLAAIRTDVNKLNRRLVGYKQVRNVELRTTPFEKTTSMKIKRHLVK